MVDLEQLANDAPAWLPNAVRRFDLLRAFLWYIAIIFVISLVTRLRFYRSIFHIVHYVRESCPNVYELIRQHWILCVANGLVSLFGAYVATLLVYVSFNRLVLPETHLSIVRLAEPRPTLLCWNLILIGMMFAVDFVLLMQITFIDVPSVKQTLEEAEGWLGGRLNNWLGYLGRWNPIQRYADKQARENLVGFNSIFRSSLAVQIGQLIVRMTVAASLFASYTGWL